MNILYIALGNGLNPGIGGSLTRSVNIAKNLKNQGHKITFAITSGSKKACKDLGLETNFIEIPAWFGKPPPKERSKLDRVTANLASTLHFPSHLKQGPFNIIYSDSDYFCDVIPALYIKRKTKAKWVAMVHHQIKINPQNLATFFISFLSYIQQGLMWLIVKLFANSIFVYKSSMGKQIANFFRGKVHFVENGIDTSLINSISSKKKKFGACMIGGLRPSKGLYNIVPIWKKVIEEIPQATLVIVGGGLKEYETHLEKEVKKAELQNNIFLKGALANKEALKYLKSSKIFFFPSHEEGWGIAILEALSCKKPVIAYDLPVYSNIFKNTIITVELGNINMFAKQTCKLLKSHAKTKAKEGYSLAKNYDWKSIAKKESQIFKKIIKE